MISRFLKSAQSLVHLLCRWKTSCSFVVGLLQYGAPSGFCKYIASDFEDRKLRAKGNKDGLNVNID